MNRSALIRDALRRHLKHLRELELEEQDRRGYLAKPQTEDEFKVWEAAAVWPEPLNRGEIRWYRFPPPDKLRPVLVLTRDAVISHLATVTVVPITSTIRDVPSEVILDLDDGMKNRCAVNPHNAVTVAQTGVGRLVASLSSERMEEVCTALRFSLGCG